MALARVYLPHAITGFELGERVESEIAPSGALLVKGTHKTLYIPPSGEYVLAIDHGVLGYKGRPLNEGE